MKNYYCPTCNKYVDTEIVEELETLNVRGQNIQLRVKIRICKCCNEPIIDETLDEMTLKQFYDEYRRRNHLLFPDEIKRIREKYNMSQSEFGKILGMGEKTITRYENGAIQERTHDNLIRAINNHYVYEDFLSRYKKSNMESNDADLPLEAQTRLSFSLVKDKVEGAKCFNFKVEKNSGGKKNARRKLFA